MISHDQSWTWILEILFESKYINASLALPPVMTDLLPKISPAWQNLWVLSHLQDVKLLRQDMQTLKALVKSLSIMEHISILLRLFAIFWFALPLSSWSSQCLPKGALTASDLPRAYESAAQDVRGDVSRIDSGVLYMPWVRNWKLFSLVFTELTRKL